MRGKLILAIVGLAFIAALTMAGINHHKRVAMETKCVQQMAMLWEMARSHVVEAGLSVDTAISQADLWQYMGGQFSTNMRCPLGPSVYSPFTFRNGPQCPYSEAHNQALAKISAQPAYKMYKMIVEREDRERKTR